MGRTSHPVILIVTLAVLSVVSSADRLYGQLGTSSPPNQQLIDPVANVPSSNAGMPSTIVMGSGDVEGVVGKEVRSSADENIGRIVEIVVDRSGQVRAAVIDFGGFLGIGNRRIAVDWNLLQFVTVGDARGRLTLKLTQDQIRAAPEYKPGKVVVIVSALGDAASWRSSGLAKLER